MVNAQVTIISALLGLSMACTSVSAQDGTGMERMENELCGCMTMVDVKAKDAVLEQQVRHCLEEAVVNHPAAMNALLRSAQGQESKGFQLGEIIGKRLAPRCPALKAVSERLRRIHASDGTSKSES